MTQTLTEASTDVTEQPRNDEDATKISSESPLTAGKPTEQLDMELPSEARAAEDETHYATGTKLFLLMLSMGLALIAGGMDASIVAVAVPAMTDHWHTVADVGWYSAAFRLCMCSFQFMFGKLYRLFSVKKIFLISLVIFLVGSTLCAAAPSSSAFVVGRAVCGFSAAGIVSGCYALIMRTLPLRKRPLYASIAAAIEGTAVITSPILGGVLVEKLSWRWCFWINLPLGGVTWLIVAIFLQDIRPTEQTTWRQKLSQLDLVGNLVFVPSLTCLFMALSWAGVKYPWSSPTIIGLLCVFVVLLAVFAVDQWLKQDTATLPPNVLKNRSVLSGFVFSLCCNSAMQVVEYYLPTYFQAVREYSPSKSGYLMLPLVIGFLISMLIQGAGVRIFGYYVPFMLAGSILMPIFSGMMTTLTVETDLATILVYSGLLGFAGGIGFQSPQTAVQNTLPTSQANTGIAIILFAQGFGPAIFVASAQTIFTSQLSENLNRLVPNVNATNIESMGLSELKSHLGAENLHQTLLGFDKSLIQTWYLAVGLTCVTMIGSATMEWKSIKQKKS